ncbi:MAG: DUF1992 domain-containing protein [Bdellovibrionia bacterium]
MSGVGRFWRTAEQKIREAMERGEFDNLPGKGKPLKLSERNPYIARDQQIVQDMLKDSHLVPEEVNLMRRVERLQQRLEKESDKLSEIETRAIRKQITNLQIEIQIKLERRGG